MIRIHVEKILARLWFYIKWMYIIWIAVLVAPAISHIALMLQGQYVDLAQWKFMIVSGIKYNWLIGFFGFVVETVIKLITGRLFKLDSNPNQPHRSQSIEEVVIGEVIDDELRAIAASSYNSRQLMAISLKWVSSRLDDLRNGGIWTPSYVDKVNCVTCGRATWHVLETDQSGNWTRGCKCNECQTRRTA